MAECNDAAMPRIALARIPLGIFIGRMSARRVLPAPAAAFLPLLAPAALAASLFVLESARPLRPPASGRVRRALRNLSVSLPGMAAMALVEKLNRPPVKAPGGSGEFPGAMPICGVTIVTTGDLLMFS